MVKRYDNVFDEMLEESKGDFVLYSDYAALEATIKRADDIRLTLTDDNEKQDEQISALTAELDAWKSVFGTTQLTHAQARLEQAEKMAGKLTATVSERDKEIALLREGLFPEQLKIIDALKEAHHE